MRRSILVLAGLLSLAAPATAWDQDFFGQYGRRSDVMSFGAGNAKESNATTHTISPWPPHVMDRRIEGNGERMVGAVERYRDPSKANRAPCPLTPQFDIQASGVRAQTATQCGAANAIQGIGANIGQPGTTTTVVTPGIAATQSTR